MFDRNTIIALIVIGLLLLLTPYYYRLVNPPPPETEKPAVAPAPVETPTPKAEEPKVEATAPAGTAPVLLPASQQIDPNFVRVETPLYSLAISSSGQITDYQLKRYRTYSGTPVILTSKDATGKEIGTLDLDFVSQALESLGQIQFTKVREIQKVTEEPDSVVLRTWWR